jgi:two-component system, cell cycle response regulator CtrA
MSRNDEIGELKERIRQLEDILVPSNIAYPAAWRLTRTQSVVLSCLVGGVDGYRSKDQVYYAINSTSKRYANADLTGTNVGVHICHLRNKLRPFGIVVKNRKGQGYQLDANSLKILRELHRAGNAALKQLGKT